MYEFSTLENKTIQRAATWARSLGVINIVMGLLQLQNGASGLINLGIYVAIGVALIQSAKSLDLVVKTEGNDIAHLMSAVRSLTKLFTIRLAMIVVGLIVALLALAVLMLILEGLKTAFH